MGDSIPNEVLFEHIFLRLQVKSLIRCKSVCKNWNKVINDPDFARKHLRFHQRQRVLLQLHQNYVSVDIGTGDTHKISKVTQSMKIVGSSNGLLCGLVGASNWKSLQIWNPSTGDLKLVKSGPSLHIPHCDFNRFGFCYDSVKNDFKIVYLNSQKSGQLKKVKFDIYSLKSDSWKIIREFDGLSNLEGITPTTRGYDVNGTIYWIVNRNIINFDVLVFSVRENKFRKLQLPQGCRILNNYATKLSVLGSSLGLYHYSARDRSVLLWKLEGQNEEWSKLMYITQPSRLFEDVKNLHPLCLTESNEVVLFNSQKFVSEKGFKLHDEGSKYNFMFYEEMSKINFILYDEVTNGIKNMNIRGICHVHPIMQREVYVESLVSPHTITRNDDVPVQKKRKHRNNAAG